MKYPVPWTWTKLNSFETCPFRFLKCDVQKAFSEAESDQLIWGNKVHKAIEDALRPVCDGKPAGALPPDMAPYQKYVDRLARGTGELLVEQKYAISRDFQPCDYFSPIAWLRIRVDAVRIDPPVAMPVDWKTGARKMDPNNLQLFLAAAAIFSHHKDVEAVSSRFVWLSDDEEDDELFTRAKAREIWTDNMLPRVERMMRAAEMDLFPPKPGGLCKRWCPVTTCEFHGKGSR